MGLFKKLFANKKQKSNEPNRSTNKDKPIKGLSFTISTDENNSVSISSSPIGVSTGSSADDFYVYEWFIKDTGEVFYIGKGRGDRFRAFHERAYEAEKIREIYETDSRFVGTGLTEEQAIELESKEMIRILNETNDRLTNRIIPLFTKRDNGYSRSPITPKLEFEKAPYLYASEIEEHYFGIKGRAFDEVQDEYLKFVVFITRSMRDEISIIYAGNLTKYQDETTDLLSMNRSRILSTQFAKSVTAWIYIGDDYVTNYDIDQQKALERLGRNIPTYHLLDVHQFLKEKHGEIKSVLKEEVTIHPVHNRVPLSDIRNLHNWDKGFDKGMPFWKQGEEERKAGDLENAIRLFDKARYNGYNAPALYNSYAIAYRKLKDYDNEIAIIDEAIERLMSEKKNVSDTTILKFKERREKSLLLKQRQES